MPKYALTHISEYNDPYIYIHEKCNISPKEFDTICAALVYLKCFKISVTTHQVDIQRGNITEPLTMETYNNSTFILSSKDPQISKWYIDAWKCCIICSIAQSLTIYEHYPIPDLANWVSFTGTFLILEEYQVSSNEDCFAPFGFRGHSFERPGMSVQ